MQSQKYNQSGNSGHSQAWSRQNPTANGPQGDYHVGHEQSPNMSAQACMACAGCWGQQTQQTWACPVHVTEANLWRPWMTQARASWHPGQASAPPSLGNLRATRFRAALNPACSPSRPLRLLGCEVGPSGPTPGPAPKPTPSTPNQPHSPSQPGALLGLHAARGAALQPPPCWVRRAQGSGTSLASTLR